VARCEALQSTTSRPPTRPLSTSCGAAALGPFWGFDAEEADASGADVERIAIDHLGTPGDDGVGFKGLHVWHVGQQQECGNDGSAYTTCCMMTVRSQCFFLMLQLDEKVRRISFRNERGVDC
jgi:hypothetical protein